MSRTSDLVDIMVDVRDQDRLECGRRLFELLGYNNSAFITEPQLDELLFKAVRKCLGTDIHADMLLMAFGLLPGYEYTNLAIGDRRVRFLRKSRWLKVNRRSKIKDYDSANEDDQVDAWDSLRNTEKYWMGKIADEFIKHINLSDKNGAIKYIKTLDSYLDEVQDASGKTIDYVPKTPPQLPSTDENDTLDEEMANSEETSEQNEQEDELLSGESKAPPHSDTPPEKGPTPNLPKAHTNHFSIGPFINIGEKSQINLSLVKNPVFLTIAGIVVVLVLWRLSSPVSSNTFIILGSHIILSPNQIYELLAVSSLDKNTDSVLRYVSSDPSVVAVGEYNGMLQTPASHEVGGIQTANITAQDDHGNTAITTVEVNFSAGGGNINIQPNNSAGGGNINIQPDDFVPDFAVTQKVRLAGDSEWRDYVEANLGDVIEVQIEYQNTGETAHSNVIMRSVLPANLAYVPETTLLYNGSLSEGASSNPDSLTTKGVNIGNYEPQANAFVRFSVKVVDVNLAAGSNTLVNWVRVTVDNVTLQDYASVIATKE